MLFAADQVPGTVVPLGVVIVAVPSALKVMLFITPFVWTWTVLPTISDPGVQAWAATAPIGATIAAPKNAAFNNPVLVIARAPSGW
jgi:hypothetical protein